MKKTLALLILLSVTLLPVSSHLHAEPKAPANFDKIMLELGSLSQKLGEAGKSLFKIQQTLDQIARKEYELGNDDKSKTISALVDSIKNIDSGCSLTSDVLFVGSMAKEKYYKVLINYLRDGIEHEKRQLEYNRDSLRYHYNNIRGDAALHQANRAIDIIKRVSDLYDETLLLLPTED
jgi:hypothetical protein